MAFEAVKVHSSHKGLNGTMTGNLTQIALKFRLSNH